MKLALAVAMGVLAAVYAIMRLRQTLDALASLGEIVAECRRSWKVAVLWFVCFASVCLGLGLLIASQPPWQIALAFVITVLTFICANRLGERLRPSPFYYERHPDDPQGEARRR